MVLLVLMPMRMAAWLSSDTARIALPTRVFLMNSWRATISATDMTMVRMLMPENWMLPMVTGATSKTALIGRGEEEKKISARFWRQRLTAMAVMSTERLGAPRSGL